MIFVLGGTGVLGNAIIRVSPDRSCYVPTRAEYDLASSVSPSGQFTVAYLCGGTKGFADCEGNRKAFRADVDGNIRLAKHLLSKGTFVVFVSTEAVEWVANAAYARNRLLVEMALIMQPNVAIVRPGKFDEQTVEPLARLCVDVGSNKREGLHYWP